LAKGRVRRKTQIPTTQATREVRPDRDIWIYIALVLVTFGVYAQAGRFDFVNYDDPEYVRNPHTLQGLTLAGVEWAFTSGDAANWFPLTRLSHMLDVQWFGLEAGMHHLMNVLFHSLAALFLFAFLVRATKLRWPSAFVAFVFALHPLHVESVAWVAERKDVLNAFFWFLTLWCYVRYTEQPGRGRYLILLGAFCLGLLTKPMILTLPFVLLLLDFWPLKRRLALLEKLPLFAIAAAGAVGTYLVQESSRAVKTLSVFPVGMRVENAVVSYGIYIEKTFWPECLAVFYPYPASIPAWELALSGAVLVSLSLVVIAFRRMCPYLPVGWFWFIGTLVPVIGFVQVGAQARADRYMYVPMVGLLIMLAWGAVDVVTLWPGMKTAVLGLAAAMCLGCAISTSVQLSYWRDSESLFAHALSVTKRNYVAEHNYGLAVSTAPGRLAEAIEHYQNALAIRPDSVEARSDFGSGLAQMGLFNDAIAQYQTALRMAPDCSICRTNLELARKQMAEHALHEGVAFQKMGRTEEAIAQFEAALKAEPSYAEAQNDLGVALGSLGQTEEAIEHFSAALQLQPDYADARYNLDLALKQKK
jgi:Flp pilus assembly protein TadD